MGASVARRTVVVTNRLGIHARPAVLIVTLARQFNAAITLIKDNMRVEATEVLQVLSLGAGQGQQLELEASGADAPQALDAMEQLFIHKFDEE
ncbi:MAG: HPr family phosphocarrier protein [Thermoguttaceae bacterium]